MCVPSTTPSGLDPASFRSPLFAIVRGFELSGKIQRSDFGVKTYVPLIGDDVDLIISAGFEHT